MLLFFGCTKFEILSEIQENTYVKSTAGYMNLELRTEALRMRSSQQGMGRQKRLAISTKMGRLVDCC